MEDAPIQHKKQHGHGIIPYRFKPGVSGNPDGRPKGAKSMKTWVKEYLQSLSEEERIEFINTQSGELVWKMAEGNPQTTTDVTLTTDIKFTQEQIDATRKALGLGPIEIDGSSK